LLERRWMPEEQMDLVLEHLNAIRDHIDDMKHMFDASDRCLIRVETTIADIQWMQADKARTVARINGKIDRICRDVDGIRRRLELIG
jgi:hypothetical protein